MNTIANNIKQRLSLREPLAEALDVVARLADGLDLKKQPQTTDDERVAYQAWLRGQLAQAQTICPHCRNFEREFPSFAFSIATGIGKTRLMGACIAYLYLAKGIRHFFILAPNLTLYEKLIRDFGDASYEKYVFKGIAEFVNNKPVVITGDNYNTAKGLFSSNEIQINIFNIAKFNTESTDSKRGTARMRRLSEYLGQSYFEYLASLPDLVILMDEAHRYHANASKKAIDELLPILGLEMTATPTDERGKAFKNIVYEYNLAEALSDGKYVKIPTIATRKNFQATGLSSDELDRIKIEDAISIHEQTKTHLELYARNNDLLLVKPFVLIICRNIEHASQTQKLIEEELFSGKYRGKVLQIDSSTKKDEEVDRLFVSLERPDNRIEVVIHVNMLKEGWDVTNLYTIVPLRAADAPILVEQSIGRGLRLPYGGKRTGDADVDKLTVIAHDNFQRVIEASNDVNSVLNKVSYVELEDDDFAVEPSRVVTVQTKLDLLEQKAIETARTEIEKANAQVVSDARRAVWNVIPQLSTAVKSTSELATPEMRKTLKELAIRDIQSSARNVHPLFAEQIANDQLEEIDKVIDVVVKDYIENIIPIPRMTVMKEVIEQKFNTFDLDVSIGFDLLELQSEIYRISVGAGEKQVDSFEVKSGQTYNNPLNTIVGELVTYAEIDYDTCSELLYQLAQQAVGAITANVGQEANVAKIVHDYRKAIAANIHSQMMRHFVVKSQGYAKPKVLPFTTLVEQHLTEVIGVGRCDFRIVVKPAFVRKFIYTGFMKTYYIENKFDSVTELDFVNVLESDNDVLRWLRPAATQFSIYWANGARRYEPDFVVETADCIYMVETKAQKDISDEDVLAKKAAAEAYCKNATEFTLANGGKPWTYMLLPHSEVKRTASFSYLCAMAVK